MDPHNWKKNPLKFDPNRGYWLCEPCWNGVHINKPYRDHLGVRHPKVYNCMLSKFKGLGNCGCGCTDPGPKKIKFTHEGQNELFTKNI